MLISFTRSERSRGSGNDAGLARISQQLPGQIRGPLGGVDDIAQHPPRRARARYRIQRHAGVSENARQQIIEIVSDASREQANTFQPLRLLQLRLEARVLPAPFGFPKLPLHHRRQAIQMVCE